MQLKFRRILHVVLAAQALPLICGLLIVIALQIVIINTEHSTKNEEQARLALKSCSDVQKVLMRGVISLFEYSQSGLDSDLTGYRKTREQLSKVTGQLRDLSTAYPAEAPIIEQLLQIAKSFNRIGDEEIAIQKLGHDFATVRLSELHAELEYGFERWGTLSRDLNITLLQDLKLSPVSTQSYMVTLARILVVGLVGIFTACLLTSRLLTVYIDKRLKVVHDNSFRLADGMPLLAPLSGADEIATLDREFHSMTAAISQARKREKEILEYATDIILTIDDNLEIKSANAASVRMWGQTKLGGASFPSLAPVPVQSRLRRFFDHCKMSGQAGFIEVPLSAGTQEVYASVSAQWSDENRLFSCLIHDITERKLAEDAVRENERRLRAMIEQMPAGMLLVDQSGTVLGANQVAARMLVTPGLELEGQPLSALLPIATNLPEVQWLETAFRERHILLPLNVAGESKHVEISVDKVAFGDRENFLLVMLDITANQKLELLRRQLIDGISDNIISPLSSINSVIVDLHSDAESEHNDRLAKYLSTALLESDRLLKLFSDLLEIESSNIRQLSVHKRDVSIQELMERSMEAVRVSAEKKGITLSSQPTTARMSADPDRIVQVLINLVFNALKFTPNGGYIKLESSMPNDDSIELRVMDSGCGIPEGMEQKIFEPFKQTKVSDQLAKGGSGLGLFICKSIIEKHGGTISAGNHPGGGAVFYMRLPVKEEAMSAAATAATKAD